MTIRVLIADDHGLVRTGIAALLSAMPEIEVVGQAANGEEAIEMVANLQPDVLLLDLIMPGISGIATLARIRDGHPATRVLVLSMHSSQELVAHALSLGASGYILKDAAPDELEKGIEAVMAGRRWLSEQIAKIAVAPGNSQSASLRRINSLSERQRQVLTLLAEGHSRRSISEQLNLSIKTVETHCAQIMEKLNIHDVPGLVRYAIREGLVPL